MSAVRRLCSYAKALAIPIGLAAPSSAVAQGAPGAVGEAFTPSINTRALPRVMYDMRSDEVGVGLRFDPFHVTDRGTDLQTWYGDSWRRGGGTVWGYFTYDPDRNLLYYSTGNCGPWNADYRREWGVVTLDQNGGVVDYANNGCSTQLARDATTGELIWAYELAPADSWDFDAPLINPLPPEFGGDTRSAATRAGRSIYDIDKWYFGTPEDRRRYTQPDPAAPAGGVPVPDYAGTAAQWCIGITAGTWQNGAWTPRSGCWWTDPVWPGAGYDPITGLPCWSGLVNDPVAVPALGSLGTDAVRYRRSGATIYVYNPPGGLEPGSGCPQWHVLPPFVVDPVPPTIGVTVTPGGLPPPGESCPTCYITDPGYTGGIVRVAFNSVGPGGASPELDRLYRGTSSAGAFADSCTAAVSVLLAPHTTPATTIPSIAAVLGDALEKSNYPVCQLAGATGYVHACRLALTNYSSHCLANPNPLDRPTGNATLFGAASGAPTPPDPAAPPVMTADELATVAGATGILYQRPTADWPAKIVCTATRINANWVLTAAHCVWGKKRNGARGLRTTLDLEFYPFGTGEEVPAPVALDWRYPAENTPAGVDPTDSDFPREKDYVLLRVHAPTGDVPTIAMATPVRWSKLIVMSFQYIDYLTYQLDSIEKGQRFQTDEELVATGNWRAFMRYDASPGCFIQSEPDRMLIQHGCPTDWRTSGAAIFQRDPAGGAPGIIGVHVGGEPTQTDGTCRDDGCIGRLNIGVQLAGTDITFMQQPRRSTGANP